MGVPTVPKKNVADTSSTHDLREAKKERPVSINREGSLKERPTTGR